MIQIKQKELTSFTNKIRGRDWYKENRKRKLDYQTNYNNEHTKQIKNYRKDYYIRTGK